MGLPAGVAPLQTCVELIKAELSNQIGFLRKPQYFPHFIVKSTATHAGPQSALDNKCAVIGSGNKTSGYWHQGVVTSIHIFSHPTCT